MQLWRLNPRARLRRTPRGGAVFLPDAITTIELDVEAFTTVVLLSKPHNVRQLRSYLTVELRRNFTVAEIDILLRELSARGVVSITTLEEASAQPRAAMPCRLAPESAHLQLNGVCNLSCPSCYAALQSQDSGTLPLDRIGALIDEWAKMGVFQLALGGGEPLLSPKLVPVVRLARQRGIVPNVTTNGLLITEKLLGEIQGSLGELRMSLNDAATDQLPQLEAKAVLLRASQQPFGFNLIVTRRNLERLPALFSWVCAQGAGTLNLIRPKPVPGNRQWYQENSLSMADATRLRAILHDQQPLFNRTRLTVDCAFSFLFHGESADELQARGVAGCALGERFACVKWNGDVFPCSHLYGEQFKAGNVMSASFGEIWDYSKAFTTIRADLPSVTGKCGSCRHNALCKGCRAVMWQKSGDWLVADQDCPVSSLPNTSVVG
ncbi:MAG TPA: SPASM domain-containing protein [Clostridia bacterium]|nr:SPASM domain-containing protein [Clostridia bacterium]